MNHLVFHDFFFLFFISQLQILVFTNTHISKKRKEKQKKYTLTVNIVNILLIKMLLTYLHTRLTARKRTHLTNTSRV